VEVIPKLREHLGDSGEGSLRGRVWEKGQSKAEFRRQQTRRDTLPKKSDLAALIATKKIEEKKKIGIQSTNPMPTRNNKKGRKPTETNRAETANKDKTMNFSMRDISGYGVKKGQNRGGGEREGGNGSVTDRKSLGEAPKRS